MKNVSLVSFIKEFKELLARAEEKAWKRYRFDAEQAAVINRYNNELLRIIKQLLRRGLKSKFPYADLAQLICKRAKVLQAAFDAYMPHMDAEQDAALRAYVKILNRLVAREIGEYSSEKVLVLRK